MLDFLFPKSAKEQKKKLALKSLLHKVSYRLPQSAKDDVLIGFRMLRRLFTTSKKEFVHTFETNDTNVAILDGTFKFQELELDYLSRLGVAPAHFIAKEFLSISLVKYPYLCAKSFFLGLFIGFKCLFDKNRANLALAIKSYAEIRILTRFLIENKIKAIYDFVPFENDSNWLYLELEKLGIQHVKLVSPGPLALHNRILLADTLIYNTPYQKEEVDFFADSILTNEIKKWPPEYAFTFIKKYRNQEDSTGIASNFLGFYSHASWLRKQEDHADIGLNLANEEKSLLQLLATLSSKSNENSLCVFLHPREKKADIFPETKQFYTQAFGESISFGNLDLPSSAQFENADIGVCSYSAIIYERLFAGFKILIYTPSDGNNVAKFPLKNSSIRNVCFRNIDELKVLIQKNQTLSRKEFFEVNNLHGYPFWDFDNLPA